MTTEMKGTRIVTGCLATMLLSFGTILASTIPVTERPAAFPTHSEADFALVPLPLASSPTMTPWMSQSFVQFSPAGMSPLKPANEQQPMAKTMKTPPAVPDDVPPATVQNLRRADGR